MELPTEKGAYLLALHLARPFAGTLRGTPFALSPGWYTYCGSANGPGGIKARVSRHFRSDKKSHWHVDPLTVAAEDMWSFAFPGGSECELVAFLMETSAFSQPLPGFGSSDCASCRSHLLRLEDQSK